MHRQVSSLLNEAYTDLPMFLMGHSMGCMALNTYLNINPDIVKKISGVIYSAPFFEFGPFVDAPLLKRYAFHVLALVLDDFILGSGMAAQYITSNKKYMKNELPRFKNYNFLSIGCIASFDR